ncbi:metallophosphoesterase [Rhizobium skierniewicense]|uniref:metallophosphoesterase n=1 Tax=Rhizobium skierniewicense TaxID=984260 RepID=UPI0015735DA3|nr:metallophosphoesterase [Rhizobium skierniewicense]NTF35017.1 metallophosphoesterase [Rhizobium skierniewicense]
MRVFALSDLHLDYEENRIWLKGLSDQEYRADWLIFAGDISGDVTLAERCFAALSSKFAKVFFVPGNHDLWVRSHEGGHSLDKFHVIVRLAMDHGLLTEPHREAGLTIVPILGWYDYSFGIPGAQLLQGWMDYRACLWPDAMTAKQVTEYFLRLNEEAFQRLAQREEENLHAAFKDNEVLISFSHFVPRLDVLPSFISPEFHYIYPVLGSSAIDRQVRHWRGERHIHVYGHSHVNRSVVIDDIHYINNAFGYPSEASISRKGLFCIYDAPHVVRR